MSRDVKVICIYSLKSVFNVFLGETHSWVPLNNHATAINSRIYLIVGGTKLYI